MADERECKGRVPKATKEAMASEGLTTLRQSNKTWLQAPLGTRLEYLQERWPEVHFEHNFQTIRIGVVHLGCFPSTESVVDTVLAALTAEMHQIVRALGALYATAPLTSAYTT